MSHKGTFPRTKPSKEIQSGLSDVYKETEIPEIWTSKTTRLLQKNTFDLILWILDNEGKEIDKAT